MPSFFSTACSAVDFSSYSSVSHLVGRAGQVSPNSKAASLVAIRDLLTLPAATQFTRLPQGLAFVDY